MLTPVAAQQVRSLANVSVMNWTQALGASRLQDSDYRRFRLTGILQRRPSGAGRKKLLLAGGIGFHPTMDGERREKTIRASEITQTLYRSTHVSQHMAKSLLTIFPKVRRGREKPAEKGKRDRRANNPEILFFKREATRFFSCFT